MKKIIVSLLAAFVVSLSFVNAQVEQVNLTQIEGAFMTESLMLTPGDYQFNITNKDVDHEVGFVLVPAGKYDASMHIKEAYVTAPVPTGMTKATNVVSLTEGTYEYFCPLNPTEKYMLKVAGDVQTVKFSQMPGKFEQDGRMLESGTYQFVVANNGVESPVGFVLVPKGKYAAEHHIKAAYVSAPVANGTMAKTGIIELEAGEYEYFCPLNKTEKYSLTVK